MSAPSATASAPDLPWSLRLGLGLGRRARFFRELAALVEAALPLARAVQIAAEHVAPALGGALAREIRDGRPLSEALGRFPGLFPALDRRLVEAGERGGTLDEALRSLAEALEAREAARQALLSRLMYPLLVLHAAFFLPPLPRLLTAGPGDYLRASLGLLLPLYAVALAGWLVHRLGGRLPALRAGLDHALAWVPWLGGCLRALALARFLDSLARFLAAGVPPGRGLEWAAATCGDALVEARLARARPVLDEGLSLGAALAAAGVVPKLALHLVQTGEEAGRVPEMLARAAALLGEEAERGIQRLLSVLPVLLMLGVGALVAWSVLDFYRGQLQLFQQL